MAIDEETRQRLDREWARERFLERLFLRTLMFWFIGVVIWHALPFAANEQNWQAILTVAILCGKIAGAVAAGLGFLVTLAWIGSGGKILSDDFFDE